MMGVAEGIRKLGFRKWYERQLLESHAWLVSGFLGMILVATALEVFEVRSLFLRLLAGVALGAIGWLVWSRYVCALGLAERLGHGATCRQCGKYGSFEVLASGPERPPPGAREIDPATIWLKVRCRQCGHQWTI
jgi:hypothetical protein